MNASNWTDLIRGGGLDATFVRLYGSDGTAKAADRYVALISSHRKRYGGGDLRIFSAPGRIELGGNHTDHNRGKALAGAVSLDAVAIVSVPDTASDSISVYSEDFGSGYELSSMDAAKRPSEEGSSLSLIRGITAWFQREGMKTGGFNATVQSNVFSGSGLSSSACFEVLIASVIDGLFNGWSLHPSRRALCGKFAENEYFGKPCGLLDQLTCSTGGVIAIDFRDPASPAVEGVDVAFNDYGFRLCIIVTKSDHAADTETYASIPRDMKKVAAWFGKSVLRDVGREEFVTAVPKLMKEFPGRAVNRAWHFMNENVRVERMVAALSGGDFPSYLRLVELSGNSSFKYLQNVIHETDNQDYGLALHMVESFDSSPAVVSRMHGGGFGGTVQAYVPEREWERFRQTMEDSLGSGAVVPLSLRNDGAIEISP